MKRLYLIRHGRTAWNAEGRYQGQTDVALDDEGRRQARALAERLRSEPIDALYTSDLQRASLTAAVLGEALGLVPVPDIALREIGCGLFEGVISAEIRERWPEERDRFWRREAGPPEGETIDVVRSRMLGVYDRLHAEHAGETVAVVSHGFAMRVLCSHLFDVPDGTHPEMAPMTNTSFTVLDFDGGRPIVHTASEDAHATCEQEAKAAAESSGEFYHALQLQLGGEVRVVRVNTGYWIATLHLPVPGGKTAFLQYTTEHRCLPQGLDPKD